MVEAAPPQQSPFARLARANAASAVGDVFLAISLAESLFFDVSPTAARPKILLYLLLTMLPFSVLAPLIGPLLDRHPGGRRTLMAVGFLGRAFLCFFLSRNVDSLVLYPIVFLILVLGKGHAVARGSLVPSVTTQNQTLVRANARLSLVALSFGMLAAGPALLVLHVFGASAVLTVASAVYLFGTVLAFKVPRTSVADAVASDLPERLELHIRSIAASGTAMALLRASVGFLTFFIAFALKSDGKSATYYGAAIGFSAFGGLVGVLIAPAVRAVLHEKVMLAVGLLVPGVTALFSTRIEGSWALFLVGMTVACGAALGRQAFDSLVQRDVPERARGRAFARFETRFQVAWVFGALISLVDWPRTVGLFIVAVLLLVGAGIYAWSWTSRQT